ncbi:MAG TPA: CvfD/Ygs/GSP13 family RNA-binding post-transcriptional regulator [Erysipelotrichaceae bacterium]|nr:CvfD/Ygs/GSP13 family RNA-binding post-transcriptional regulator [Erysipelotrichaceae bacterium]
MMYRVGQVVEGQITGIKPYGAFVSIDANTAGLIHISELSEGFVKDVEHYVKVGDKLKLKILDIDSQNHQLRLSLKALHANSRKSRPRLKPMIKLREKIGFASLKAQLNDWIKDAKKEKNHD